MFTKTTLSKVISVAVAVLLVLSGYFFYLDQTQKQSQIRDQGLNSNAFKDGKILDLEVVEVADSAQERARGLMYRLELCEKCGMLFVFQYPEQLSFWMRNTYIPLDIIFLDENGKITKINANTEPKNEEILYDSRSPAMYALEVNAGYSKANNIQDGDLINLNELLNNAKPYQF